MKIERLFKKKDGSKREFGNIVIWLVFISLILKTFWFVLIGTSDNGVKFAGFTPDFKLLPAQIAGICILIFPVYFFKKRKQLWYLLIIDILYTGLLIVDLWYYRAAGEYIGLRHLFFSGMYNPMNRSIINPNSLDIPFICDISILLILIFKTKLFIDKKRNVIVGIIGIIIPMIVIYSVEYKDGKRDGYLGYGWGAAVEMRAMWPIGYHTFEAANVLKEKTKKIDEKQIEEVNQWFKENKEDLPNNKYFGMLKGKNVIYVQMESLEDFVIGQKVYGQDITPNIDKMMKNSIYFNNFYEQNNGGNSIDCDMMANSGMLTLGDRITFIERGHIQYPSMARVLQGNGYDAVSTHAESGGDYNWAEAHKNALGFRHMWDKQDYNIDEIVGFGLSDRSFYNQYADKLKTLKQPFFSMIPNLSNHGPFNIQQELRALKLPKNLDKTKLGGYFQSVHYADEQLGFFIEKLKELGLMKNTVLVIYGDHGGVHKYYQKELKDIDLPGDWWQKYEKKVPLLIYGEGIKGETVSTIGGQIDITPTMLGLLGIDPKVEFMGRNLLNTKVDATVIKGNKIIGNPTKEQREHLEKAYTIAKYIINNNYYVEENKVN